MVTLKEIFTVYWPQTTFMVTLVFGLMGYVVNRYFDLRKQKQITNHSLMQEHRMKAVNEFLNATTAMRTAFSGFPIYGALMGQISVDQIDTLVSNSLDKLKARTIEIRIFFPEETVFLEITNLNDGLNQYLYNLYTVTKDKRELNRRSDAYINTTNEVLKKVDDKMFPLAQVVRKTYMA